MVWRQHCYRGGPKVGVLVSLLGHGLAGFLCSNTVLVCLCSFRSVSQSINLCVLVEVRGQSVGVGSFLLAHRSWGSNLVIRLGGKSMAQTLLCLSED